LAYGASASLAGSAFEPRSVLTLSASASSDKAEIALFNLKDVLAIALKEGFADAEVARAKNTWVQDRKRYANEERLFAARLSQGMLNGRDFSWIAHYDERIAAVTPKAASEALRKYIGAAPIVWMIGKGGK
jgi:zinc protease